MNLRSSKILLLLTLCLIMLAGSPAYADELESVQPNIIKYNDFYRFTFKAKEYLPFDILVDNNDIIIDFERANSLDLTPFIYDKSIIKSFGASADSKSFIIRLNNGSLKVRKFIADNNVTGFDLFVSDSKSTRKTILMSSLPEADAAVNKNNPENISEADKTKGGPEENPGGVIANINTYKSNIIIFPPEFIGPPKIDQLVKTDPEFIGPPQYDPAKYSVFEVAKSAPGGSATPDLIVDENSLVLSFPLGDIDDVSAAALVNDDKIIIMFDTKSAINLGAIFTNPFINSVRKIPDDKYTVIELSLNRKKVTNNYQKAFYKDKQSWVLEIYSEDENKKFEINSVDINAENNFGEKRISLEAEKITGPVYIDDDLTGEKIIGYMIHNNATGILLPREFVDVEFLPSLQGIFLKEKSDFLKYDVKDDKLEITKLSNLIISDDIISTAANDAGGNSAASKSNNGIFSPKSIFPFPAHAPEKNVKPDKTKNNEELKKEDSGGEKEHEPKAKSPHKTSWLNFGEAFAEEPANQTETKPEAKDKKDGTAAPDVLDTSGIYEDNIIDDSNEAAETEKRDITSDIKDFVNRINAAKPDEKSDIKLEFAKFYFAKEFYAESLGILQDIKQNDPSYKNMFSVDTMIGANQYLTRKYGDALDTFSILAGAGNKNPSFNEIALWQWASQHMFNLKKRNIDEAPLSINFVASYDKFMQDYPLKLRYELGLMYLDEKLKAAKIEDAKNVLDIITYAGVPKSFENDTKFYRAYIADKEKDYKTSEQIYNQLLQDKDDRKNRARALVELTKGQLLKNTITNDEAIEKFLQASSIWRDDYFDMDVYEIIGNLYVTDKDYVHALATWKEIASNFPETTESVFILGKMKQLFVELFDNGIAYQMKPLETLKLYFGFRELTPAGEAGDRITRKVAKFFISADMMDEAIKIVEHQIKFRSSGDDKAKLVLWLSDIHIENRNLDLAENVLNAIKENEVSPNYIALKKYQMANITALRGNYDEALDLIKGDFSKPALKIRTELFWQRQNWFGVISTVEARLDDIRETRPLPLTKDEMTDLNRLMVAYAAQGENKKLNLLRNEFANRITSVDDELLVNYLAGGNKKVDYNNFDESVELESIEKFMNEYSYMPSETWSSSIKILEPQVAAMVGKPMDELSRENKLDIVRLAIAYSMTEPKDEKEATDLKKRLNNLARDFKDIRIDRTTIDAFSIFDDKFMPKENDAIFEGKIKLTDIPSFVNYYKNANKISNLNIAIREKFQ